MIVVKRHQDLVDIVEKLRWSQKKWKCRDFSAWIQHLVRHENYLCRLSFRTKCVSIKKLSLSQRLFSAIIQNPIPNSRRLFCRGNQGDTNFWVSLQKYHHSCRTTEIRVTKASPSNVCHQSAFSGANINKLNNGSTSLYQWMLINNM